MIEGAAGPVPQWGRYRSRALGGWGAAAGVVGASDGIYAFLLWCWTGPLVGGRGRSESLS